MEIESEEEGKVFPRTWLSIDTSMIRYEVRGEETFKNTINFCQFQFLDLKNETVYRGGKFTHGWNIFLWDLKVTRNFQNEWNEWEAVD